MTFVDGSALMEVRPANVMVSAIKQNDWDGNQNVIARFFETSGIGTNVDVTIHPALAKSIKSVRAVDLIERPNGAKCSWDAKKGVLSFKSGKFEASTFELLLA
jgi:alpha-mannosidase